MIIANGTAANDRVNKYGEILLQEAIFTAYERQWLDVLPCNVNHDSTRRIGCSRLSGIFIEPGATYLTNQVLLPESDAEKAKVDAIVRKAYVSTTEKEHGHEFEHLISLLGDVHSGNEKRIYTDSVAIIDDGIVPRMFPKLWKTMDSDGLISLNHLTPVLPGIFKYDDFLLYAHPYFRRSLTRFNSLNVPFLTLLQELPDAKIALDADMIGLAGTESQHREYAYWWGPEFDNDLAHIPLGVSHFQNENYNRLMSPIISTEFGWYIQDDIRTFECEEITDVQNINCSCNMYGCRYVHSMLSDETGLAYHLDGAVRAYDDEKMLHRLEINLKQAGRNTVYTKLWRIDQQIPVVLWKELITHYYRDNHLIGEYFGGVDRHQAEYIAGDKESASPNEFRNELIPADLQPGDGIRTFFSIEEKKDEFADFDIKFRPHTYWGIGDQSVRAIEYESLTLFKRLDMLGFSVRMPNCPRLAFNDTVFNFPMIVCKSVDIANSVIRTIFEFVNIWNHQQDDRVISFGITVNYSEYAAAYSFVGHVYDFYNLSQEFDFAIPSEQSKIIGWANNLRVHLDKYRISYLNPALSDLLSSGNYLMYKRVFIDTALENMSVDDEGCTAELTVPEKISNQISKQSITATLVVNVKSSICCKCNRPYHQCGCIKFLDSQCTDRLADFDLAGAFWTNRMA